MHFPHIRSLRNATKDRRSMRAPAERAQREDLRFSLVLVHYPCHLQWSNCTLPCGCPVERSGPLVPAKKQSMLGTYHLERTRNWSPANASSGNGLSSFFSSRTLIRTNTNYLFASWLSIQENCLAMEKSEKFTLYLPNCPYFHFNLIIPYIKFY